jgi:hypothetical protein
MWFHPFHYGEKIIYIVKNKNKVIVVIVTIGLNERNYLGKVDFAYIPPFDLGRNIVIGFWEMNVEKRKSNVSFYIITTYFNSGYLDLLGKERIQI